MKKRLWAFLACVMAMVMILSACGTEPSDQGTTAPPTLAPIELDPATIVYDKVPSGFDRESPEPGELVEIKYTVEKYSDTTVTAEKAAQVYLPYGYDASKQYNVLYLLHGGGEDEKSWFIKNVLNKRVTDNLIYNGDIEPLIIVMPTIYMPEELGFEGNADYDQFAFELRNHLIPAVESQYSTFAGSDVSEANLIATREHRALAGFSMGSMHTLEAGVVRSLDLFSWFGSFSGGSTPLEELSGALHSEEFEQYDIDYLVAINGPVDFTYEEHFALMRELEQTDDKVTDGENFQIIEIENGSHTWFTWKIALYDFLQIVFVS